MCGGDPGKKSRLELDPRMNDEEIRLSVVHLLRAYFDKSADIDPLNDERVVDVSHDHISALADIILYTSNPILHHELKEKTHNDAVAMLTNSSLRFKLPESLMCMIAYRHSQTNTLSNQILKIADDIVYTAKKSEEFWHARHDGQIEWGVCPREDVNLGYGRWNNYEYVNPYGIEGWVPAIIEHQTIHIRRNQFDMYPGRWDQSDRGKEDVFKVHLPGPHNNHWSRYVTREVLNKCPSFYGITSDINEVDWIPVKVLQQRTWIYYNPAKLSLLPKSSTVDSYIKITLTANFPHTRGCTFFAERNPQESVFINYPRSIFENNESLFVDEDAPAPPTPNTNVQTIVTRNGDTNHRFQETYMTDNQANTRYYDNIFWKYPHTNDDTIRVCNIERLLDILNYTSAYIPNRKNTFIQLINKISVDSITNLNRIWLLWQPYTYNPSLMHAYKYVDVIKLLSIYCQFDSNNGNVSDYNRFFSNLNEISRDPNTWGGEQLLDDEEEEEVVNPVSVPVTRNVYHVPNKLPTRIRDIIVADVISKGDECSITMEPLTAENLAVTSCFHFFEKTAIDKWMSENHTCPQCRERAALFA